MTENKTSVQPVNPGNTSTDKYHKPVKDWRFYTAILVRKLWTSFAVLLVSLAVFISVLRYSLPYMDSQKHYLEGWLKQEYDTVVKIGYISAMWKGKGPAIVLKDVSIGETPDSPIALTVDETQIELDFWASVKQRQIQSQRFNLIGLSLQVDIPKIKGGNEEDFPILDALQTLFLEQLERFSVSDSEVLIRNRVAQQKLQIQQLSWLNDERRHQGVGQMRVAELARNSARFVLDLHGSRDSFEGTFFAEAEDLDLSPWMKAVMPAEYELQRSRGNFKVWAGLNNSDITYVQAHMSESQFAWQAKQNGEVVKADVMKGDVFALPGINGWNFNFDDLTLIVNERVFTSHWAGAFTDGNVVTFSSRSDLNLAPLLPLAGVLMGEQVNERLASLNPQVNVQKAHFYLSKEQLGAHLEFNDLSVAENNGVPGINSFFGELSWLNNQGHISVNSIHNYLSSEDLLGFLLPYDELKFDAYLDFTAGNQHVYAPLISFRNTDLKLEQSLHYNFDDNVLSTQLVVDDSELDVVKSYFPDLMGTETRAWLLKALKQGNTMDTKVLWHGKPEEFPFSDNQGIFQAGVTIDELELKYESQWPALKNANVQLMFENESLKIEGQQGEIAGIGLSGAYAVIPELAENAHIDIRALGVGTGDLLTSLFQQSSLNDSVGEALKYIEIEGGLVADLNLHVPLDGENINVNADLLFAENDLFIPTLELELKSVNGVLKVANDVLKAEGLTAQLLAQEIKFNVDSASSQEGYQANVNFAGTWDANKLIAPYHPQIAQYVDGETDWAGQLSLLFPEQGYNYSLQLNSQLKGVTSGLPAPAAKLAEQKLPIFLDSEGDQKASTVRLLLGRDIKFNGILPHETVQFSRAHLSVGGDNFVGMGLGFSISADLEDIEYAKWQTFIGDLVEGLPDDNNPIITPPQRIFIETESLNILGQQFDNVEILAKNRDKFWELQIDADQTRAEAVLHKEWLEKGIEVEADFIKIQASDDTQNASQTNFDKRSFPPLKLKCKQCSYNDYDVGKITLEMSRSNPGMHIDSLLVQLRDGKVDATGDWFIGDTFDSTRLQGTFSSNDFGAFLKILNFDSGIRDSDANMDFDLSWQNAPYEFSTSTLGGNIRWQLGDGYLTEISDKGRLLSILSLESLIRKLSLDFRDVFAKGFFYDNMKGTFQLSDGIVSTQDTFIDGGSAGVQIRGNTDLVNNELNYLVDVKPKLTSSLPLLLAWMVNPATAVAALAFDEVITSANVVSGIQYSLTGSLKEPQITLLEQTSKVVELPAKNNLPIQSPDLPETKLEKKPGIDPKIPDELNSKDSLDGSGLKQESET